MAVGYIDNVEQAIDQLDRRVNATRDGAESATQLIGKLTHRADVAGAQLATARAEIAAAQNATIEAAAAASTNAIFCATWGPALEALTGRPGCELPIEYVGDLVLEAWHMPLVQKLRRVDGGLWVSGPSQAGFDTEAPQAGASSFVTVSLLELVEVAGPVYIYNLKMLQTMNLPKLKTVGGGVEA